MADDKSARFWNALEHAAARVDVVKALETLTITELRQIRRTIDEVRMRRKYGMCVSTPVERGASPDADA
ncbi:MAG: hypothetical protein AAFR11_05730 [Pseudomonadota bacterium]